MAAVITASKHRLWLSVLVAVVLCILSAAASASTDAQALHVLNRLAFGPAPGDVQRVASVGVEQYIQQQLHPDSISLPAELRQQLEALDTLQLSPTQLFDAYGPKRDADGAKLTPADRKALRQHAKVILQQAIEARLLRAIQSPRQLQEVMTAFWFNHFNVFAGKGLDYLWIGSYEATAIRPYALGHFHDLLMATAESPAMLFYLDNWLNTQPGAPRAKGRFQGINENYAREVMELHTLGVNGGYTQNDVTTLAHILTGWGLCPPRGIFSRPGGFCFDPQRHDSDSQVFLGSTIAGGGQQEIQQALDLLAYSPITARHLSYELTQYFVADDPPPALVDRLTHTWMQSDGDITAVLEELFESPEFWSAKYRGNKFKTPYEYVISMARASGLHMTKVQAQSKILAGMLARLGMPLYACATPDGYKNIQEVWLNPDAMMMRLSFAAFMGSGNTRLDTGDMDAHTRVTQLLDTLPGLLTATQLASINSQPQALRAGLILGSPQFQYR
ncbi:MAG TPA: DUF1800 domain-containing protein [Gammaproteobacteria bacterium]|nr:DUF1800 domain-containing protein [Gammaproteobacteria bacterium]